MPGPLQRVEAVLLNAGTLAAALVVQVIPVMSHHPPTRQWATPL